MELNATRVDGANATIKATISNEEIAANLDKIAKDIARTQKMDGFRKGKVPVAVVKKQYGDRLKEDAEAQSLQQLLTDGLKALDVTNDAVIGEPQVTSLDRGEEAMEVEVNVALRPEIDLGDYTALVPEVATPEISDEDLEKRVAELVEAQAPFVKVEDDRGLENGDMSVIDFDGKIDGEPLEGGKAENFSLAIGSGQFIPGFEDKLIGMKMGETKDIELEFPADYHKKEIAGKPVVFTVTLHEIQVKEARELTDEVAQKLLPNETDVTVEVLKSETKKQMQNELLSKEYNEKIKPELMNTLVEKIAFDLPNIVVEQEIDMAVNNKARTMSEDEIKEIQADEEKLKALREESREDAQKSVKATFIVDALALKEGVTVSEDEVTQTIYYEAMQTGQDPVQTLEQYKSAGYLPAIQMAMVEDRVLGKLLDAKMKKEDA
jgi:trigger factor